MAGKPTNISIRMDSQLKEEADSLFAQLGMNISTAFNVFVRQSIREGGIPFEVSLNPTEKTVRALLEAKAIADDPSVRGYEDVNELLAELKR